MKQLILKELREQYKVALIGMVLLTGVLIFAFVSHVNHFYEAVQNSHIAPDTQPLLDQELHFKVVFFCGTLGVILGWLQIRTERQPSLWAFLVHRPIHRTGIYLGKVVAGLLLYGVAVGLPLLGFVLMVSIPGQVAAPFTWLMALPIATLFLAGVMFYFAGLLTGLRQARWYAVRGLEVIVAVVATMALFGVREFWTAFLIVSVTGFVLALGAWGSYQSGGYFRAQPVAGKVALTLMVTVFDMVLIWLGIAFHVFALDRDFTFVGTQFHITRNGTVLQITPLRTGEKEISDEQGKTVLHEKTGQKVRYSDVQTRFARSGTVMADGKILSAQPASFFQPERYFHPYNIAKNLIWYLTADGRLVAYEATTRRFARTLSPQAAVSEEVAGEDLFLIPTGNRFFRHFDQSMRGILVNRRTAYLVDLEKLQLEPVFTAPQGDEILGYNNYPIPGSFNWNVLLILTRNTVQQFNMADHTKLVLPYVSAAPDYPQVSVYWLEPTNTYAVMFQPAHGQFDANRLPHVTWVNADGSVGNRKVLSGREVFEPQEVLVGNFIIPLAPPIIPFWSWKEPYRIWNLLRIVPAILCACVGWWLGRRNEFPRKAQVAWALHHLLFGLPGLLAFLAVHDWPVKVACPACKKPRAVDRNQCESCGADFAPPAKTGTEIFAPLSAG